MASLSFLTMFTVYWSTLDRQRVLVTGDGDVCYSRLSDAARLPSAQRPGRNCIPPGFVCGNSNPRRTAPGDRTYKELQSGEITRVGPQEEACGAPGAGRAPGVCAPREREGGRLQEGGGLRRSEPCWRANRGPQPPQL